MGTGTKETARAAGPGAQDPAGPHGGSGALRAALTSRQISMIALGGVIGTGLFLGSGQAISLAGPAVVLAYAAAAVVALVVTYALAEMTAAHPRAGGFGALAHIHLGPLAGFVQRWVYWIAQVINIGSEAVAAGMYTRMWWPGLPLWIPVAVFSLAMVGVNVLSVTFFGTFEYWFAMIKVGALVVLLSLGAVAILFGLPGQAAVGTSALVGHGGLAPNGLTGLWLATTMASFSYIGTEALSLTAAESSDPVRDIPRAARMTVFRLTAFSVLGIAVVVMIVPWTEAGSAQGVVQSPFVRLFGSAGLPAAATVMNLIVLVAALSAMNTNLFATARTLYSLGSDGWAPARLTRLSKRGTPVGALLLSAVGALGAILVSVVSPDRVFAIMIAVALFSALVTWLVILATHVAFRRSRAADAPALPIRLSGAPWTTLAAAAFVVAVLVTMAFTPYFRVGLLAGGPLLALVTAAYFVVRARTARTARRTLAAD